MAKYKTEREARQGFALECLKWCGIKEGSAEHLALIEFYNLIDPLPYGYRMTATAAWCAAFLSAVGWKLGYKNMPFECSCSRMMALAKADGIWENRSYVPEVGDWVVYDLNKNGSPDHIGVVTGREDRRVFVCEGNFSDSVKNRFDVTLGDERLIGYICPNYMELVDNSNFADGDRPNIPIEIPEIKEEETVERIYNSVDEMPEWAQEPIQALVDMGVIEGVGGGELGLSAQEMRLAVMQYRGLVKLAGKLGVELA